MDWIYFAAIFSSKINVPLVKSLHQFSLKSYKQTKRIYYEWLKMKSTPTARTKVHHSKEKVGKIDIWTGWTANQRWC